MESLLRAYSIQRRPFAASCSPLGKEYYGAKYRLKGTPPSPREPYRGDTCARSPAGLSPARLSPRNSDRSGLSDGLSIPRDEDRSQGRTRACNGRHAKAACSRAFQPHTHEQRSWGRGRGEWWGHANGSDGARRASRENARKSPGWHRLPLPPPLSNLQPRSGLPAARTI